MAKDHYFDITAKLDMMELKNALIMAEKEVATRFDFKGLKAEFNLNEAAKTLSLSSSSDSKIDALKDMGYSDVQIVEAVAITGYFNYINTLSNVFALGE